MGVTMSIVLTDETAAYLELLAAGQGRTPAEVTAWIVTEDLRREQVIDAELVARLDGSLAEAHEHLAAPQAVLDEVAYRERAGA